MSNWEEEAYRRMQLEQERVRVETLRREADREAEIGAEKSLLDERLKLLDPLDVVTRLVDINRSSYWGGMGKIETETRYFNDSSYYSGGDTLYNYGSYFTAIERRFILSASYVSEYEPRSRDNVKQRVGRHDVGVRDPFGGGSRTIHNYYGPYEEVVSCTVDGYDSKTVFPIVAVVIGYSKTTNQFSVRIGRELVPSDEFYKNDQLRRLEPGEQQRGFVPPIRGSLYGVERNVTYDGNLSLPRLQNFIDEVLLIILNTSLEYGSLPMLIRKGNERVTEINRRFPLGKTMKPNDWYRLRELP